MQVSVERIICHPNYDRDTLDNDICLLKLSARVNYTDYIYPVCLADKSSTFYSGVQSWVSGWGATANGKLSDCTVITFAFRNESPFE